ncbi:TetR family transcriptional regulator [Streptomyces albospinus]|uniref:TetR family transcriptional regulator n=1 Tax=Streptomyces albospinus TaxID=285515 RepID=A0ABQ2VA19_9ACTN|nr:TetR/AcrR family transcriptional regulator [Streptomyces albospinus]GGU70982.1 TetR family transcriptional regulator [Streptomyces albospinus]
MGTTRTPRGMWIEEGLRALSTGGPDAVRIEALAQSLGVSKRGFYGYFSDRDALLGEMLDTWERDTTEGVIEEIERGGGGTRAKLERLLTIALFTEEPGRGTAVALSVRDWARRDETVAERLRRVDNRRMDYLRSLFGSFCSGDEVEVRSMLAFTLRIGSHFVAADTVHGAERRC